MHSLLALSNSDFFCFPFLINFVCCVLLVSIIIGNNECDGFRFSCLLASVARATQSAQFFFCTVRCACLFVCFFGEMTRKRRYADLKSIAHALQARAAHNKCKCMCEAQRVNIPNYSQTKRWKWTIVRFSERVYFYCMQKPMPINEWAKQAKKYR